MIRAPTDPAARAATTSRRLDARLDDAQIIAHCSNRRTPRRSTQTPENPARPWVSRLGFRAYPITRDRAVIDAFARVHGARAPLSRVAIDAMKIIEAIDRDRVGDARRGRARTRRRSSLAASDPARSDAARDRVEHVAKLYVLVAVRAPDHHGLGVGDLAGGDGDGLRDLRGGLGDGRHDLEISVRLCRSRRGRRARQGVVRAFVFVFVRYFIRDLLCIINYVTLCKKIEKKAPFRGPTQSARELFAHTTRVASFSPGGAETCGGNDGGRDSHGVI